MRRRETPNADGDLGAVKMVSDAAASKTKHKLPNWPAIIETNPALWAQALERAKTGPRVLFATAIGGQPQFTVVESALSIALTLRGARVDSLICDGALPACQRAKVSLPEPPALARYELSQQVCPDCVVKARRVFDIPGLNRLEMSAFLQPHERDSAREIANSLPMDQAATFQHNGLPIGEHALAGALRYYGVGDMSGEPDAEPVLRRFLEASLLTASVMKRVLETGGYDVVVTNHGIYVPHGIINAVARQAGVRTVTWNTAYRRQCAIFSHGDTYHHTLIDEPTSVWRDMSWSKTNDTQITSYLHSRRNGDRDWIWFNRTPDEDLHRFSAEVGLDLSKPIVGMLTNVVWDAQLHYPSNAFINMQDWMVKTVGYFERRPDLQLLIRIHPGELAPPGDVTKSRQPAVEEIRKAFPRLPANVFIIPPESRISTYAVAEHCNSVVIYGTKMGVELSSLGIPVIVAGEAWIRGKGITYDAENEIQYFKYLDMIPIYRHLDGHKLELAKKYAYHFFFRRMIPLPFLEYRETHWPPFIVRLKSLNKLGKNRYPGLDVICDGILEGAPFIYEAETVGLHDAEAAD